MKKWILLLVLLLGVTGIAQAIPNPSAVYCILQGYEFEIRTDDQGNQYGVCVFPDGSECSSWAYYCKCEPNGITCWPGDFSCHWPCKEMRCKEAGESVLVSKCCEGLDELYPPHIFDANCNKLQLIGWLFLCSDCGNGICESWESKCNCPEDCAEPSIIYVDADANGVSDGSSWADAYNYLQDALAVALSGDEIWVAEGIYKPDQGIGITPSDRTATFQLINGVTIKGGYAGFGESDPNARGIDEYVTILTGDLNGDDGPDFTNKDDNSYHVVTGSGTDETAIVDGFTITGGYFYAVPASASGSSTWGGGGMYNESGSPTVLNCTFSGNCNVSSAGGMLNWSNSNPTLTNCTFSGNWASSGGGMYNSSNSSPRLTNCTFSGNSADIGGGMRNSSNSNPTLTKCTFSGNSARYGGGGTFTSSNSNPTLTNCTFTGNSTEGFGGGIYNQNTTTEKSGPMLTSCTFSANSAPKGGNALACDSYLQQYPGCIQVTNCIFWDGGNEIWNNDGSTITITYSDVQGGQTGIYDPCNGLFWAEGNIDANPLFADPNNGNYHLLEDSPCIDAGDPNYIAEPNETDLDGRPRVIRGRIDMGAYEFQGPWYWYVDDDANGANDGSSWADAYNYLQDALAVAVYGDEIWVAQGTYKPDQGAGIMPGDRTATFQLINGVTIKGGYAGFGEPDPNARDIDLYETILSGDLDGNDIDVNDPADLGDEPTRDENSYHVVTGNDTDSNAVLDSFTITGGNANLVDIHFYRGGGMLIDHGSLTVSNCIFRMNLACHGGGMYCRNGSNLTLTNCTFSSNAARWSAGGLCIGVSSAKLINCTFKANSANAWGGGMWIGHSYSTLIQCTFTGNSSGYSGGGMYIDYFNSHTQLKHCIFDGNIAGWYGGGIFNGLNELKLTNCTLVSNSSRGGGGVYIPPPPVPAASSSIKGYYSRSTITNSIFWENWPEQIVDSMGYRLAASYSDIQGNWRGTGNIDADPCFVQPGYWDANGVWVDGDYHLLPDSPCIDAGDPNYIAEPNETDLDGRPRVIGGRIDMGAYEYCPPLPAEVRIVPRSINLASMGKWITCYIRLPEDYEVGDIDPNSVFLEGEIRAELLWADEQEQVAIVRFSRSEVQGILEPGEVKLTVSGELTDGTVFEGRDIIRVIDKGQRR